MKRLTAKEEEIMQMFWKHGPMFVRELLAFYEEPKPHYNTVSTLVRGLEEKGFVKYRLMVIRISIMRLFPIRI